MQAERTHSTLSEADLKRKFGIKECKVVIVPLVLNEAVSLSQSKIHPVSEKMLYKSSKTKTELRNKRRNARMKRGGKGKGRRKSQGVHMRKDLVDDASNSENSDGSPLYNEINWEENLESEPALVDKFAPRIQCDLMDPKYKGKEATTDEMNPPSGSKTEEANSDSKESKSQPVIDVGTHVFVREKLGVVEHRQWLAAVVVEIDVNDQEVLVKYLEGDDPPPDEWLESGCNRISLVKPEPADNESAILTPILIERNADQGVKEAMEAIGMEAVAPVIYAHPPGGSQVNVTIDNLPEETVAQLVKSHLKSHQQIPTETKGKRSSKKGRGSSHQSKALAVTNSKFAEGEQVLAKWSEHRMQKFPGVVKKVHPDGNYDVLFYDGFEKTLSEGDVFKTNEEEIAKYEHTNPSEADRMMDLGSKEARREQKKKTFDGFIFANQVKSRRRVIKHVEKFTVPKKIENISPKPDDEAKEKEGEEGEKPFRQKRMRKKRRSLFAPKRDNSRVKLHMLDLQRTLAETPKNEPDETEGFYGFDMVEPTGQVIEKDTLDPDETETKPKTSPLPPLTPVQPPAPVPAEKTVNSPPPPAPAEKTVASPPPPAPAEKTVSSPPPLVVINPIVERWRPHGNQEYKPIDINRDGVVWKSLVVPDNYLPPGWSKHAVVSTTNNIWDVILVSPDGYQLNNIEELRHYFATINPNGGSPPSKLDFLADFNVLAELALKQKELTTSSSISRVWSSRRGGRARGRGMSGRGRPRGVRTLLPKPRVRLSSPESLPPSTPTIATPESELRCPKESCDKKFRKQSLLQMHIKHYHSEFSSLVRSVPNMVDLACARSESVNSKFPKVPPSPVKKLLPRSIPSSPIVTEDPIPRTEQFAETTPSTSNQSTSRIPESSPLAESSLLMRPSNEERRSTIKTMLPIRPSEKNVADSDDFESEDDYIEQKKNGSRIFKPGKYRKGRYMTGSRGNDSTDSGFNQVLPTYKLTRRRKNYKIHNSSDNIDNFQDKEKPQLAEDSIIIEQMKAEEFINCICGFREEDGLMIQCDICMCWQHGVCAEIEHESDVPDRYVCSICRDPFRVRSSRKYSYAEHYLTQGKLPSFSFRTRNEEEISEREAILKRCFDLQASLHEIKMIERSLAAKINIAEKADHPKLYMWSKNWEDAETRNTATVIKTKPPDEIDSERQPNMSAQSSSPQPEARIDLEDCRIRLLDHIEHCYSQLEDRLASLQTQVAALESLESDLSGSSSANDKITKQAIQMLLKDLDTVNKLAAIS